MHRNATELLQPAKAPRAFLRAEWRQLVLLNYKVAPELLEPRLPRGAELELWQGQAYVSVVGFRFLNTRLLGIRAPIWGSFAEVNLRFYVVRRSGGELRRGVAFIKEIAPHRAISAIARALYNENYVTLPMRHESSDWSDGPGGRRLEYGWLHRGRWNRVAALPVGEGRVADANSHEAFITDNYWGYAAQRDGGTLEYHVEHPPWRIWQTADATLDCDVAELYGKEFEPVLKGPPRSALVADGSPITVHFGQRIA